ncbi:MAG: hypothetical protein KatS3mg115_0947 [Candidatus Poribacteria bacterium]|nr:MAG: hypothetical protein KatS3mg115_0947 [Candidatus Poribacteria bacterium]
MDREELIEIIKARVLSELNAPRRDVSAEHGDYDRIPFLSYADEVRACRTTAGKRLIPVGVSARHCHVTQEHLEVLYGPGYELTVYTKLYQPGEFAANETVDDRRAAYASDRAGADPGGRSGATLRWSSRRQTCVILGVNAPIRNSGDLEDAAPITIVGPKGSLYLKAAICPTPPHPFKPKRGKVANGVQDGDRVMVRVGRGTGAHL